MLLNVCLVWILSVLFVPIPFSNEINVYLVSSEGDFNCKFTPDCTYLTAYDV